MCLDLLRMFDYPNSVTHHILRPNRLASYLGVREFSRSGILRDDLIEQPERVPKEV